MTHVCHSFLWANVFVLESPKNLMAALRDLTCKFQLKTQSIFLATLKSLYL